MKKAMLFLCLLFISIVSFCQIGQMKLKKKEVKYKDAVQAFQSYEGNNSSANFILTKDNFKATGVFAIRPISQPNHYVKIYDSATREVGRVDSSGRLFVTDSLATIKALLKAMNIKVKD